MDNIMEKRINFMNVLTLEGVEINSGLNQVTLHIVDDNFGTHVITLHPALLQEAYHAANHAFEKTLYNETMMQQDGK